MERFENMTKEELIVELSAARRLVTELNNEIESLRADQQGKFSGCNHEKELQPIYDMVPCGIFVCTDGSGKNIIYNLSAADFLRLKPRESIFLNEWSKKPKIFRGQVEIDIFDLPVSRSAKLGEEIVGEELQFAWEDGIKRSSLWFAKPLYDNNGALCGAVASFQDITAQTIANAQMLEQDNELQAIIRNQTCSNKQLTAILENITDACYVLDKDWRFIFINSAAEQLGFGLNKDCIGKIIWDLFPRWVDDAWGKALRKAVVKNIPVHDVVFGIHSGIWFDCHLYPYEEGLIVYCRDITDLRDAAVKIEEQARLLDLAHDYIIVHDMDNRIVFWNHGAELGYGWSEDYALGQATSVILRTEYPEPPEKIRKTLLTDGYWEGELVHSRIDGARITVMSHQTLTRDSQGNPMAILEINHDVTQQKRAEQLLRDSEIRFRTCLDQMLDSITIYKPVWDKKGEIVDFSIEFINEAGCRENEGRTREQLIGERMRNICKGMPEEAFDIYKQVMLTGESYENENEEWYDERSQQVIAIYESHVFKMGDGIANWRRNITGKRMLETDIARFDRLNVIGEMAASIGHEVRNPLTTVRGYLQLFQRKPVFSKHFEQFKTMIDELDRANFIITEFLSLAKNKAICFEDGNLNQIVDVLMPLLQASALRSGHNLAFKQGIIPDISIDKKEIRQLLLNLVRNALEAAPRGSMIIVTTEFVNNEVLLAVQDFGPGIAKQVLERLGTPFITTKEGGTGLGLPVCYRIVERHGAKLDVNTSGEGTTFTIRFTNKVSK